MALFLVFLTMVALGKWSILLSLVPLALVSSPAELYVDLARSFLEGAGGVDDTLGGL